jgi:hypothetical protein
VRGNQHRETHVAPDHLVHLLVVGERLAEVAARDNALDPQQILHRRRLIQAVAVFQVIHLDHGRGIAAGLLQRDDLLLEEAARRKLDDHERNHRDGETASGRRSAHGG